MSMVCLFLFLAASPLPAQQSVPQPPPTVVFMTDFGVVDDSVALCKGVMYGIAPNLRIVDLTHQVNAFSIRDGARFLFGARPTSRPERYLWWSSIRRGQLAQGSRREIEARTVLRAA